MSRKKNILLLIIFSLIFCLLPANGFSRDKNGRFIVVLDPGHGGKDPGAIGRRTNEKTINLNVALKVAELLKNNRDIKVFLTRNNDSFIGLNERADYANRNNADLFVSIHTNSTVSRTTSANGSEVYTLGLARTKENLEVAKKENAVILKEDNYTTKYEGFDPNSSESYIIFEYIQNRHVDASIKLASYVQNAIVHQAGRHNRGIRQAGFLVLRRTSMPSILVELGFITNQREEVFMKSAAGVKKYAEAIASAIETYKNLVDQRAGRNQIDQSNESISKKDNLKEEKISKVGSSKEYRIQILAHKQKLKASYHAFKRHREELSYYQENDLYKYTLYQFNNLREAKMKRKELRKEFPDCFIVIFVDGEKIQEVY